MEVSGQKRSKRYDVKLCSFCEDYDITTCADGFCAKCEVFTCHKCFVKHKERKISQDHSLLKIGESQQVNSTQKDSFDLCQQHSEEFIKHYCPNHDQVCCGECIVLQHNGCELELIRDKAIAFKNSDHLNNLSRDIKKCIKQAQDSVSLVESNSQFLSDCHGQFVRDVDIFVDKIIEHINAMKRVVLDRGKEIMLKDKIRMDALNKEIDELIAEISQQNDQLESKRDQPNKLFVASTSIKTELKKSLQRLDLLKKKNTVTNYTFKQDQIFDTILKEKKAVGVLLELPEMFKQRQSDVEQAVKSKESQKQVLQVQQTALGNRSELNKGPVLREETPVHSDKGSKPTHHKDKMTTITTQTNEKTLFVSQQKYQPFIQRQKLCKNLNIDGQILSYAASAKNEVGIYVDKRSLKVGDFFEIEIVSIGSGGSIALGVVSTNYPDNLLPGVGRGSEGYHSDGRMCWDGRHEGSKGERWKVGDRVGCRISSINLMVYFIVFTHNGREVNSFAFRPADYHFAVGMMSEGDKVKVIF